MYAPKRSYLSHLVHEALFGDDEDVIVCNLDTRKSPRSEEEVAMMIKSELEKIGIAA